MNKLNTSSEHYEEQQEKHDAYLKAGFKLKSTRQNKDLAVRKYTKTENCVPREEVLKELKEDRKTAKQLYHNQVIQYIDAKIERLGYD